MTQSPKLKHALEAWPLFEFSDPKGRWAVGSSSIDRYLTVPAKSVDAVQLTLRLMDGRQTIEEIATAVRAQIGWEVDVARLARLAESAGLLTESVKGGERARSQFDRLSLTLIELPLSRPLGWIEENVTRLPGIWLKMQLAIGIVATVIVVLLPPRAHSGALPLTAVIVACALSLLAHEASHCFVALGNGIRATSLSVAIYAGVMPIVYVKLPGIFRLTSADRLRVWTAGCTCNAVIAVAAAALARIAGPGGQSGVFWTYLEHWNVALITVSLVPFLPTDGYFILSTLLRTHNLRSRAYGAAAAILHGRFSGLDWKPVIFLLAGLATIIVGLLSSAAQWGKWVQREGIPPALGWTVPFFLFAFAWILKSAGVAINEWRWRRPMTKSALARARS